MRAAPGRRSGPQLEQRQVQRTEQHRGYCSCEMGWRDGDCQVSPRGPAPCCPRVRAPGGSCVVGCLPPPAVWACPCSSAAVPSLPPAVSSPPLCSLSKALVWLRFDTDGKFILKSKDTNGIWKSGRSVNLADG